MAYKIEIKDDEGIHTYELDNLENIDLLLTQHPEYESLVAKEEKKDE